MAAIFGEIFFFLIEIAIKILKKFEMGGFLVRQNFLENWDDYSAEIPRR